MLVELVALTFGAEKLGMVGLCYTFDRNETPA